MSNYEGTVLSRSMESLWIERRIPSNAAFPPLIDRGASGIDQVEPAYLKYGHVRSEIPLTCP